MKGLNQFRRFDWNGFASDKTFQVVSVADWADHDTGHHLGKRVTVVITQDNTPYAFKEGQMFTNLFERLTFKVTGDTSVAIGDIMVPIDAVARCYGEFTNQLSVTCKGIRVVPPQEAPKAKE